MHLKTVLSFLLDLQALLGDTIDITLSNDNHCVDVVMKDK
jgi:hypothetical protein